MPRYATTTEGKRTYSPPGFDATEFISVTTILNILAKPALITWSAKQAAQCAVKEEGAWKAIQQEEDDQAAIAFIRDAGRRYTSRTADLGSRVHHACERWPDHTCLADAAPYVEQFAKWVSDYKVEFLHREMTVLNPELGYAGTADGIVRFDGCTFLFDIKTGGVWPSAALQLAAYSRATHYVRGDTSLPVDWEVDGAFVLDLKPRSYNVAWCDVAEETWCAFKKCRALWKWEHEVARSVFL